MGIRPEVEPFLISCFMKMRCDLYLSIPVGLNSDANAFGNSLVDSLELSLSGGTRFLASEECIPLLFTVWFLEEDLLYEVLETEFPDFWSLFSISFASLTPLFDISPPSSSLEL